MFIKTSRKTGGRVLDSRDLQDEFVAKDLSRRQMVQSVMLGSVGAWLGAAGLAGCSGDATGSSSGNTPEGGVGADGGTSDGNIVKPGHLIGMGYHASDRSEALNAALKETIGLGMIKAGQSVYLRVNCNSGDLYPYSTSADTILQVGGMLRDIGVTDIRIGDRSFWGDQNTAANMVKNGVTGAATKLGTTAVVFDDKVDWVTLPSEVHPNWTGTVRLPKAVVEADHMIILSCVKTHFIAQITMSLKISLGLVHASDRSRAGNLKTHDTNVLHKQTAQINKAFTPSLVIQDGYSAVISGGPTVNDKPPGAPAGFTKGITGDPKVFIVSTDRVAADVAGIAVLQTLSPSYEYVHKTKPFANPGIVEAINIELPGSIKDPSAFDLSGPTVPELETYRAKVTG
ncbi:MAG: DUF362 domain-containing protein [Polyangiaceae bacterium]